MTATEPRSDAAAAPDPGESTGEEMTLFEHLTELRGRIFKSAVAIVLGLIAGFIVYRPVLDILIRPYCDLPAELRFPSTVLDPENCQLVVTDVLGQFFLVIKVAAVVAVVLAGPVVCYQIWRFVTPGLRPVEKRYAAPFIIISQLLFVGGAVFSYYILPRALEVLLGFAGENIGSLLEANEYLRFLIHMMIGFGIAFELPLILISLVLMGAVTSQTLRTYRRHALFGTFVASAIITPTTDPLTMTLMAGPLVFFYEVSILVGRVVERRRRRRETAAA
jgi:sec-independent protein translocase protein TatC